MMKHTLESSTVAMIMAFTSGCMSPDEPAPGDEQGIESRDSAAETVGTAALPLTSVSYSTYFGGTGDEGGSGTAVDSAGNVYVAGTIWPSTDATSNIFVRKMSPAGALIYDVTIGTGHEEGAGIAVDSSGNAYVAGATRSYGGSYDVLVVKLNAAGTALLYNAYFGGSNDDAAAGIAVDGAGNAYVAGRTYSKNFPTTPGAFRTTPGSTTDPVAARADGFVATLDAAGSAFVYSTYLGGDDDDSAQSITVDGFGYAYVAGWTHSLDFPTTAGAFQTSHGGGDSLDAFVTKLLPSGSALYYSTYLGGDGYDEGAAIAIDESFNAYVSGWTSSLDFPTTAGAFQANSGGGFDAFVTKLNASGNSADYSTYLGGSSTETCSDIAVDGAGNAYVTGSTVSTDFPTTSGAFRTFNSGYWDAFVTELNPVGSALSYSTYVGGSLNDSGGSIAVTTSGAAYVAGCTGSTNFPTHSAAQPAYGGGFMDGFALKINGPFGAASGGAKLDFNGDGKPDILWHNQSTGEGYVYYMNGSVIAGQNYLFTTPPIWRLAGTPDLNGDGWPDILWHNQSTGEGYVYYMNGSVIAGQNYLFTTPPIWRLAGTPDLNGDGWPDILWHNQSTGEGYVYYMNGSVIAGQAHLFTTLPVWQIGGT